MEYKNKKIVLRHIHSGYTVPCQPVGALVHCWHLASSHAPESHGLLPSIQGPIPYHIPYLPYPEERYYPCVDNDLVSINTFRTWAMAASQKRSTQLTQCYSFQLPIPGRDSFFLLPLL